VFASKSFSVGFLTIFFSFIYLRAGVLLLLAAPNQYCLIFISLLKVRKTLPHGHGGILMIAAGFSKDFYIWFRALG
jgi:hypothetical protein